MQFTKFIQSENIEECCALKEPTFPAPICEEMQLQNEFHSHIEIQALGPDVRSAAKVQ